MWVPLTYRVYRPLTEAVTLRIGIDLGHLDPVRFRPFVDMEVHPEEIGLPAGWTRTETPLLAVRVTRADLEGIRTEVNGNIRVPLRVTLERTWDLERCVSVSQEWILFNIEEPE